MSAYLFRLKSRAFALGLTAYELARRRFMRSGCVGCVDEVGTIRFKPSLHVRSDLPDNYQILTRTLIS